MILGFKEAIASYWAMSKAFRVVTIVAFLVLIAVPIFLLTWYARVLFGYSFLVIFIIVRLVFWYIARKNGDVEQFKQLSPKHYYYARRVQCIVGGGFFTGFVIMLILSGFFSPLPSPHSFLLFLTLIIVGAYMGDKLGKKLGWYP